MHESENLLPNLYSNEERSAWSVGMRAITRALLLDLALHAGPLVELGCGGGAFLAELRGVYPRRAVYGFDINPIALSFAQHRLGAPAPVAQATLERLPFDDESFAAVIALDVLDQRGVDFSAALAEARRVLRPGGALLMRVSAYAWLYSAHDHAFNTGVRYDRRTLSAPLLDAGFTIQRLTYANALLSPLAVLMRLFQRGGVAQSPSLQQHPSAERLLAAALRREAFWLRRRDLPFGISLYALAHKATP